MIWDMIKQCRISEGSLKFPNNETKETLFFVFNQLGETPDAQTEAAVETTEQPEAEATADTTEQLEAEAVAEEELEVEEVAKVEEPQGIVDAVYSYALKAKRAPGHEGYLQFSLADPAVKFAVSHSTLFHILILILTMKSVLQTLLPNNRPPHARHLRLQSQNHSRRYRTRRKDLLQPQEASGGAPNSENEIQHSELVCLFQALHQTPA